jgi:hypothetical protein
MMRLIRGQLGWCEMALTAVIIKALRRRVSADDHGPESGGRLVESPMDLKLKQMCGCDALLSSSIRSMMTRPSSAKPDKQTKRFVMLQVPVLLPVLRLR